MSESPKSSPSQPRTPKWIVPSTLLVLALSIVALAVAGLSSRARKAQEDELRAQQEKLKTIESQLAADQQKIKEQEQKLQTQQEDLAAARRSRFRVSRLPITLNKTGNEVCSEHGEVCIAVTPSKAYDAQDRFCGYNMIDCNSRIRAAEGCGKTETGEVYNYRIDRTSFSHSPGADGKCEESSSPCLSEPVHNDAICTSELSEPPSRRRRRERPPPPDPSASAAASAVPAPPAAPAP